MKNMIIADGGSVQKIPTVPADIKAIYKTVWEISQKKILDLAADRGAYVCQSQSLNVHLQAPTTGQLTSMHFYGWKRGLKTGMYYLRSRPAAQAIQFTIDQTALKESKKAAANAGVAPPVANGIPSPSPPPVAASKAPKANGVNGHANGHANSNSAANGSASMMSALDGVLSNVSDTDSSSLPASPAVSHSDASSPAPASLSATTPEPVAALTLPPSALSTPTAKPESDAAAAEEADADPEYAEALRKQAERDLEREKMMCSIYNREACEMCSG